MTFVCIVFVSNHVHCVFKPVLNVEVTAMFSSNWLEHQADCVYIPGVVESRNGPVEVS